MDEIVHAQKIIELGSVSEQTKASAVFGHIEMQTGTRYSISWIEDDL